MKSIAIIIPVFRPTAVISSICAELIADSHKEYYVEELILVDDSDSDADWICVREIARSHPRVIAVRLARNAGQHAALLAGVRQTTAKIIVTLDDDGQHPPREIPVLLAALEGAVDVVYAYPSVVVHGWIRGVGSRLVRTLLARATGVPEMRQMSAFRAFRTEVVKSWAGFGGADVNIDVLLSWSTRRFRAVATQHQIRQAGRSGYNTWRLMRHLLNLYIGYTIWPLRIASITGLCASFVGLTVLCYVVVVYMLNPDPVPGFAFIASTIAFFAGAQLLALGIVGEYLARIHLRSMGRPTYVVREVVGARTEASGVERGEASGSVGE